MIPVHFSLDQEQLSEMSDETIFQMCRKYGSSALYWRQKFIGLLPEVNRRRLYEKKGFVSIFEFAKKLAGLSEEQVRTTLNIEKRFEDKPILKSLLVNGEVSINKLSRIASVATGENQEFWANQVKLLPIRALNTLVHDEQIAKKSAVNFEDQNGFREPLFEAKSLYVHSNLQPNLELSNEEDFQFSLELKIKLRELSSKGININALLLELLEKHELEIARQKEQIASEMSNNEPSRYIPVKIKKLLHREHGSKCSIKTCNRSAQNIHHTQRFALAGTHDPHYLAPLCKEHHLIAHSIDIKLHKARSP